jgi:cytochrome c oxidase cbb3-type subunit 3
MVRARGARAPPLVSMPSSILARARSRAALLALALGAAACGRHPAASGGPSAATSTAEPPRASPSAGVAASTSATALTPGERGKAAFLRYCALCHGKDATGYAADNAPSLVSRTFLESATDAFIASGIRDGRPGTAMGAYGKSRSGPLEDADVDAIVTFLRSHGPAPHTLPTSALKGDAVRGATLFKEHCETCHGSEKERKTALSLFNPRLLAAATPEFLRFAIENGRPPTPMPAFAKQLTAQDIEDTLAWVLSKKVVEAEPAAPETVPTNLPLVINPKGKAPSFTLREERYVAADDLKKALAERRKLIIIDARSPQDWLDFHIPGAISGPYYLVEELKKLPNDGTFIVAYCACPHHASGEVVDALRRLGYKRTAVLDEGILVWKSRGYPLAGHLKQ